MVVNFEKPTKSAPSLLTHSEAETFFHEFGHVMHNMCTEANFASFSGATVARDFVEMPSQMLENWTWDKKVLARLSKHYKTGESLPEDLIDKKIAIKNLGNAQNTLS